MWCNPPGLPSWRLSDGHAHTAASPKNGHVYVHAGGDINWHTWTRARLRARIHTYTYRHHLSSAKAGRRKTLHSAAAQGTACMSLLFCQPYNDDKSRWVTENFVVRSQPLMAQIDWTEIPLLNLYLHSDFIAQGWSSLNYTMSAPTCRSFWRLK